MAEFGKFVEETFIDGAPPAINADRLNELERVVQNVDQELAYSNTKKLSELIDYFAYKNTKQILTFTSYSNWYNAYSSNGTLSDDSDLPIIGNNSVKDTAIVATAGWLSIDTSAAPVSLDLTKFEDEISTSNTDDFIIAVVYLSNAAAFNEIEFRFGSSQTNCYFWQTYGVYTLVTGWNVIKMQKSDFTENGTPPGWDNITYIRLSPYLNAGYSGAVVAWNYILLCRKDADTITWANPFQKYFGTTTTWVNEFDLVDVSNQYFLFYYDYCSFVLKAGLMKPMGGNNPAMLHLYCSVIEFISKFEMQCKYAGETCCITWYVDSNNYAIIYISSDTFYLDVYEASVKTATSRALTNGLIKNERIYMYFEKQEDTFRAILKKDDEIPIILEYETSISSDSDGCIYIGSLSNNSLAFITDFEIGYKAIRNSLQNENLPRYIRMHTEQNFANTTATNIERLYSYLPPNGAYKIDIFISVSCDSASPKFRLNWEVTNCTGYSSRFVFGPPESATDMSDTNVQMTEYAYATNVIYGVETSVDETYIRETAILTTGFTTGKIQLKASQAYSYPAYPVTVNYKSFILITKINPQAVDLT